MSILATLHPHACITSQPIRSAHAEVGCWCHRLAMLVLRATMQRKHKSATLKVTRFKFMTHRIHSDKMKNISQIDISYLKHVFPWVERKKQKPGWKCIRRPYSHLFKTLHVMSFQQYSNNRRNTEWRHTIMSLYVQYPSIVHIKAASMSFDLIKCPFLSIFCGGLLL